MPTCFTWGENRGWGGERPDDFCHHQFHPKENVDWQLNCPLVTFPERGLPRKWAFQGWRREECGVISSDPISAGAGPGSSRSDVHGSITLHTVPNLFHHAWPQLNQLPCMCFWSPHVIGFNLPLPLGAVRTALMSTYSGLSVSFVCGSSVPVACPVLAEVCCCCWYCAEWPLQMISFEPADPDVSRWSPFLLFHTAELQVQQWRNGLFKDPPLCQQGHSKDIHLSPQIVSPLLSFTPGLTDKWMGAPCPTWPFSQSDFCFRNVNKTAACLIHVLNTNVVMNQVSGTSVDKKEGQRKRRAFVLGKTFMLWTWILPSRVALPVPRANSLVWLCLLS